MEEPQDIDEYRILNKATFHIGGLFEKWKLVKTLISLNEQYPEMFMSHIRSVYGAQSGMIWNGGRFIFKSENTSNQEIRDFLLSRNITPCLITSNLTETRMDDIAVRIIEDFGVRNLNFCVGNDSIEDMLLLLGACQSQFISSTTKCLDLIDTIKACSKYKRVVLAEELNNHFKLLPNFDKSVTSRLEVLVNTPCSEPCEKRYEHYLCISKSNLENSHPRCLRGENSCGPLNHIKYNSLFVDLNGIIRYIGNGVTHFKIAGRTAFDWDWINSVVYYLVLPQYRDYIREELLYVAYNKI